MKKFKKFLPVIACIFLGMSVSYIIASFILWELNVSKWHEMFRLLSIGVGGLFSGVAYIAYIDSNETF